ncbi:MAG: leucine-rich repeat domain-containing protein, partial [Bacteroidota bacterium]
IFKNRKQSDYMNYPKTTTRLAPGRGQGWVLVKQMSTITFLICCLLAPLHAQSNCEDATQIIRLAERDLANRTYERAINRLLDARDICPAKKQQVNTLIKKAFRQIEGEKRAAEALADERKARQAVEKEKQRALAAERRADSALQVTRRVLNQMYFYEGKFGLTIKEFREEYEEFRIEYRYGYIDRNGETVIPFQFEEATPFSTKDGFARVSINQRRYLLDTLGRTYLLAESLSELTVETQALDLTAQIPRSLPSDIGRYQQLEILLLGTDGGQQLEALPASFVNLEKLRYLNLQNHAISQLPADFGRLDQLQELNLYSNALLSLPESFGQLQQLDKLSLGNNGLTQLPESFGDLRSLRLLDIGQNQLNQLPESFGNFPEMVELILGFNKLKALPDNFGKMPRLQRLNIAHNALEGLPDSFTGLRSLQYVSLSLNQISQLPATIDQLQSLENLELKQNQLSDLPMGILQIKSLQALDLNDNKLNSLPEDWSELTNLTSLYLERNQLTQIPASIGRLERLLFLDLRRNQLSSLPASITQLSKLRSLYLSENKIQSLPEDISQLQQLERLMIDQNQLRSLPNSLCEIAGLRFSTSLNRLVIGDQWSESIVADNPLAQLPACLLEKLLAEEVVNIIHGGLQEANASLARQSLQYLKDQHPEVFEQYVASFRERLASISDQDDADWKAIREMLKP